MKAFVYLRVSTEEQKKHGLSVDAQKKALEEYCKENNIEIYDFYNDAGKSAHVSYTKRKELLRLISDAKEGKAAIILFTRLDRWFRSLGDYYAVMSQIPDTVPWKAIWEDYETVTSAGRFKVNIMLSIAQAEAERTSEKIRETFEYKRAKGDYVGSAPFGYVRSNNRLIKDKDNEKYVEAVFQTYLETKSVLRTTEKLQAMGSTITKSGVFCMLKNETYMGNAKGTECEPYITQEQFNKIKVIRSRNYRTPVHDRIYLFHRLIICEKCGHHLYGNTTPYSEKVEHVSYTCHGLNLNGHKGSISISEKKVEKYLLDNLENLISDYNIQVSRIVSDNEKSDIEDERKKLNNKLERIGIRFELGDYSVDEYKQKRLEIQNELSNLPTCETFKSTPIELPNDWKSIYVSLDREHKKMFWETIIDRIMIDNNHNLTVIFA